LGYVNLATANDHYSVLCLFGARSDSFGKGQISLGHFVTTLTVSSMAYAELEPISNLAEVAMLRCCDFMSLWQPAGIDAASLVISSTTAATPIASLEN